MIHQTRRMLRSSRKVIGDKQKCITIKPNSWKLYKKKLNRGCTQKDIRIDMKRLLATFVKIPNWKPPGHDRVRGFWMKNLGGFNRKLALG